MLTLEYPTEMGGGGWILTSWASVSMYVLRHCSLERRMRTRRSQQKQERVVWEMISAASGKFDAETETLLRRVNALLE